MFGFIISGLFLYYSMCQYNFLYYYSFIVSIKIGQCVHLTVLFQNYFGYSGSFDILYNFQNLWICIRQPFWNYFGILLDQQIKLRRINILTILSLLNDENVVSLHFTQIFLGLSAFYSLQHTETSCILLDLCPSNSYLFVLL